MQEIDKKAIIFILKKRKWILILFPVVFAVLGWIVSQLMVPKYTSTAVVAVGNLKNDVYNDPQAVQHLMISRDVLESITKKLNLNLNIDSLQKSVKVMPSEKGSIIQIENSYSNPETTQKITDELVNSFMKKSEQAYQEKTEPLTQLIDNMQKQKQQLEQSINRNKTALTAVETENRFTNLEKDITRTRLNDYILNEENLIYELNSKIKNVQVELSDFKKSTLIEQSNLPVIPTSPCPLLNVGLALLLGFMLSIFLVFLVEDLAKKN